MRWVCLVTMFLGFSAVAASVKPKCTRVGTPWEGWELDGEVLKRERCAGAWAECINVGTQIEGWVKVSKVDLGVLEYGKCSESGSTVPRCEAVNTRSEGWVMPDGRRLFALCAGEFAECSGVGTRSEAWLRVQNVREQMIQFATCSK